MLQDHHQQLDAPVTTVVYTVYSEVGPTPMDTRKKQQLKLKTLIMQIVTRWPRKTQRDER